MEQHSFRVVRQERSSLRYPNSLNLSLILFMEKLVSVRIFERKQSELTVQGAYSALLFFPDHALFGLHETNFAIEGRFVVKFVLSVAYVLP